MPIHNVQLAQTATARGWAKSFGTSAKDAQIINGIPEVAINPVIGTKSVYVSKRGGSTTSATTIGGSGAAKILKARTGNDGLQLYISGSTDILYDQNGTALGTIGGTPDNLNVCDSIVDETQIYAFIAGAAGWFLYEDAITKNFPTFSASLTSGQATVVGLASTGGIYDGQLWTGSGIPASTRVSDVLDSSRVLLSATVTESGSKTVTKEAVAKITDTTVASLISTGGTTMESLDGYFFFGAFGKIWQSALNDPATWGGSDSVAADYSGDAIRCIFKVKDYIVAAGTSGTIQYFYNAGNSSGSVLSPAEHLTVTGLTFRGSPVFAQSGGYVVASSELQADDTFSMALYRLTGVNEFTKVSDDIWSGIITDGSCSNLHTGVIGNQHVIILSGSLSLGSSVFIAYYPSVNQFGFLQLASGSFTSSYGRRFTKASSTSTFIWASGNTWTDSDAAYTLTIQTEPQDMAQGADTTDTWVDLLADVESSGTATLDVSDDDYQSWVNKGSFDMTKNKKRINALGLHQGPRAYRIQHSANTGFRGQILRINHQPSSL